MQYLETVLTHIRQNYILSFQGLIFSIKLHVNIDRQQGNPLSIQILINKLFEQFHVNVTGNVGSPEQWLLVSVPVLGWQAATATPLDCANSLRIIYLILCLLTVFNTYFRMLILSILPGIYGIIFLGQETERFPIRICL